jgi:hypothetical protein
MWSAKQMETAGGLKPDWISDQVGRPKYTEDVIHQDGGNLVRIKSKSSYVTLFKF